MTEAVVSRLHRCLVDAVRQRAGGTPDGPVKVSEIYQSLVPYQAVRSELGVELNADYEHALLRLLAGEQGLLRLEPDEAREELRREVESPYPFVGIFRKFSTCNVWIQMPGADPLETAAQEQAAELNGSGGNGAHAPDVALEAARPPRRAAAPAPAREPEPPMTERTPAARADDCGFCGGDLPSGRRVRFCPSCGADQRQRPCPKCDEVLERSWRFCIGCGTEVGTTG